MTRIAMVGVSHHTAPIEVRERLALTAARNRCLVGGIVSAGDASGAVALSTCNRTELYVTGEGADAAELLEMARAELLAIAGERSAVPVDALYEHRGEAAVLHLYRVAAGLDSLVPGEAEILGQVRESLALARAESAAGATMNRLFESAIETARRVRNETTIGERAASVGSVAAELAREELAGLAEANVLLVGAGKIAELVAVNLLARGAAHVQVMNRTLLKANELAERFGGEAVPMDELGQRLADADVVICATAAPHAVISADSVRAALAGRPERPLVLIDLAVPRDVAPEAAAIEGCRLHDIDDLERVIAANIGHRSVEAVAGETIVAESAERFRRWRDSLDVVPAITGLRRLAEEVRTQELAKAEGRWESLSERDRELLDQVTRQIVNKLLHEPTVRMRELASTSDAGALAETLNALFDLHAGTPAE